MVLRKSHDQSRMPMDQARNDGSWERSSQKELPFLQKKLLHSGKNAQQLGCTFEAN